MIVFTVNSYTSGLFYGGNGVLAAYKTVDLMGRVRFPPNFRKVRIKRRSSFRLEKQFISCFLRKQGQNSSLALTISRNITYGGNGVLAAYKTVDLMGRVRFPLAALNTLNLCFPQAEVLRTESQAKLEDVYYGQSIRICNTICPKGPNKELTKIRRKIK